MVEKEKRQACRPAVVKRFLVEARGLEPLASALRTPRSAKLSYAPMRRIDIRGRVRERQARRESHSASNSLTRDSWFDIRLRRGALIVRPRTRRRAETSSGFSPSPSRRTAVQESNAKGQAAQNPPHRPLRQIGRAHV